MLFDFMFINITEILRSNMSLPFYQVNKRNLLKWKKKYIFHEEITKFVHFKAMSEFCNWSKAGCVKAIQSSNQCLIFA